MYAKYICWFLYAYLFFITINDKEQISSRMSFSKKKSSKFNIVSIMICLILNLGCECQTIVISLKNGVLLHQSNGQDIYQIAGKANGKTSWISSSNAALWYNAASDDWMIGSVDNLGTTFGGASSTGSQGRSSCPYNVPNDAWQYSNDGWIIADANDVSIECLTGNHSFW